MAAATATKRRTATKRKTAVKVKTPKQKLAEDIKAVEDLAEKKALHAREITSEEDLPYAIKSGRRNTSRNKIPLQVRTLLADFLGTVLPDLMGRMDELSLEKQWEVVGRILPYVTPKMISNDINATVELDTVDNQLQSLAAESIPQQITQG